MVMCAFVKLVLFLLKRYKWVFGCLFMVRVQRSYTVEDLVFSRLSTYSYINKVAKSRVVEQAIAEFLDRNEKKLKKTKGGK